jgi:P-type Cu+ transporter
MKTKVLIIDGMSCMHCVNRVQKALNGIPGVEATVDLDSKSAKVVYKEDISEEDLRHVVDEAGYSVTDIS